MAGRTVGSRGLGRPRAAAREGFTELVVPELRRRGRFREEDEGATLRANLGLPVPENRYARARRQRGGTVPA